MKISGSLMFMREEIRLSKFHGMGKNFATLVFINI